MIDIIERAEAALEGISKPPWTVDPEAPEPDDYDSDAWVDVDGPMGGWVAHCQDKDVARFIAWARTGVPELVAELKAARAKYSADYAEFSRIRGDLVSELAAARAQAQEDQ